jgi:prepilin-type N-terminal cleavage/methylation domain-containing protein
MSRPSSRGFTLIELLIAMAIMAVAVAAASAALINQYHGLQHADLTRLSTGESRAAIQSIEHNLRLLGWGIDPRYGIDLKYGCSSTPCRDRTNAPDDLVFVARDPLYQWTNLDDTMPDGGTCTGSNGCFGPNSNVWPVSVATSTGVISVVLPTGTYFHKGQVVLVTCSEGLHAAMLTLSAKSSVGDGTSTVTLTPYTTAAVPYNDLAGIQGCHSSGVMFLVNRYHYFVQGLNTNTGNACTSFSTTCVPWLMLDTGLDLNDDGNLPIDPATGLVTDQADLIPVAKNVEDMQVAYVLNSTDVPSGVTAPDSNGDWVLGNDKTSSTAEEPVFGSTGQVSGGSLNPYSDGSNSDTRFSADPGNVRAVRVSLRIRSDHTDSSHTSNWAGDQVPYAENRSGNAQTAGYRQYTAETEIYTRNLESRLPFIY